jgi:hypothetical protein
MDKKILYTKQNVLYLIWIFIICSLNTNYENIIKYNHILDFNRALLGIAAPFLIFFIILKEFFERKNFNFIALGFKFFLLYLFLQVFGLIFTGNDILNFYWILISATTIFVFILTNKKDIIITLFKYYSVLIVFLTMVFLFFLPSYIKNYFFSVDLSMYAHWPDGTQIKIFSNNLPPRSSGFGRIASLLSLFFLLLHIFFKRFSRINYSIYCFLACIVILTFSRANILALFISIIIILFFNYRYFKKIFKNTILFIFVPLIIVISTNLIKQSLIYNKTEISSEIFNDQHLAFRKDFKNIEKLNLNKFTSGRLNDWKNIISNTYVKSPIYGFGAQGDRFLINQSSSSAFVYAFSSSGFMGLFIFFVIYLRSFWITFSIFQKKNIFIKLNFENFFSLLASSSIIFLLIRSLFESSIAVFGIDFIVFIICLSVCEFIYKKNNV